MSVRNYKYVIPAGLLRGILLLVLAGAPLAQFSTGQDKAVSTDRNAKVNGPTADNQKNGPEDRMMLQKIRRAVVQDKSLSTAAHNVKIMVQGGQVTLRGVVRTDAEKQAVEAKAAEVAGAGKVTNEVTVAPDKKSEKQAQIDASKK